MLKLFLNAKLMECKHVYPALKDNTLINMYTENLFDISELYISIWRNGPINHLFAVYFGLFSLILLQAFLVTSKWWIEKVKLSTTKS